MAEITAAHVKELRDKTGAGMMDCKKALTENGGDIEAAVDWLRSKGIASAAKRSGRVASEGLVAVVTSEGGGAIVELNSETDFVARNEVFQELVRAVAGIALAEGGDIDKIKAAAYPDADCSVDEQITQSAATIGENLQLRRAAALSVDRGLVASYVHNAAAPGLGKIGVLVALESTADHAALEGLGKQLAMHIAATNPASVGTDELDPALVERERAVLTEQARESGRPDDIIAKMIEGRLRKYFQEVVLLEQTFAIDGESKVADVVAAAGKEAGAEIAVAGFARLALGEGLEQE
jgi:elongation factor Ts